MGIVEIVLLAFIILMALLGGSCLFRLAQSRRKRRAFKSAAGT